MKSLAGIYLVAGANTFQRRVPAHAKNFHMDAGCVVQQGPTFHAFRYLSFFMLKCLLPSQLQSNKKWKLGDSGHLRPLFQLKFSSTQI